MVTRTATIVNEYGIHVRPSAVMVKRFRDYAGTVEVITAKGTVTDAKNLLGLISLGLTMNQEITIRITGEREEEWAAIAVELFQTKFDFDR